MSSKHGDAVSTGIFNHIESSPPKHDDAELEEEQTYEFEESRKLGVVGAVFLILNKMIGTGGLQGLPLTQ